jgi:CheY-like chemotaxis protein
MGGAIGAQSEPGRGSTFWFELELADADSGDAFPSLSGWAAAGPSPVRAEPAIVLVVEDSPINQIVAVRALERCGCRAKVANNGLEALEALAAEHYDAVLMDCQMPEMDGYEATLELRRREGHARHTPVIAMTANAMEGDRERCLDAGMDDYVSKPMRPSELAQTLARWITVPADDDGERHTDVA